MDTISILISLCIFFVGYLTLQLIRNHKVYSIRRKWLLEDDIKWRKYSYDYMMDPSPKNMYGLKFPKESDFK